MKYLAGGLLMWWAMNIFGMTIKVMHENGGVTQCTSWREKEASTMLGLTRECVAWKEKTNGS